MSRYYVRNGMHYGTADEMIDLIEELEAKLAKAVEFIGKLKQYAVAIDDRHLHGKAVSTLAELTGGKDE